MSLDRNCEFLIHQHTYCLESIKIFDQKAASIIAITVGALYVLTTLHQKPTPLLEAISGMPRYFRCKSETILWICDIFHFPLVIATEVASVLLLVLAMLFSLSAVYSYSGVADANVIGGDLTIPTRIINPGNRDHAKPAQEIFQKKLFAASNEDLAKDLVALVHSRCLIREVKANNSNWSICFAYWGILMFGLRVAYSIDCTRKQKKPNSQNIESIPAMEAVTSAVSGEDSIPENVSHHSTEHGTSADT